MYERLRGFADLFYIETESLFLIRDIFQSGLEPVLNFDVSVLAGTLEETLDGCGKTRREVATGIGVIDCLGYVRGRNLCAAKTRRGVKGSWVREFLVVNEDGAL